MSLYENIKNNFKEAEIIPIYRVGQDEFIKSLGSTRLDSLGVDIDNIELYKRVDTSDDAPDKVNYLINAEITWDGDKGVTQPISYNINDDYWENEPNPSILGVFDEDLDYQIYDGVIDTIKGLIKPVDDIKESDIGYDYWGSIEMTPFSGPAYIQYYGGPGHLEYVYKSGSGNGRYRFMDFSNGDPYVFDSYKDALKVQQKLGGEILSYDRDYLGKDLEEAEEIVNDIINPDDKDYANTLYEVGIWSGAGYDLNTFKVYANDAESALEIVVAYCEDNASGLLMTVDEVEKEINNDYKKEFAEQFANNSDSEYDFMNFASDYLNYVYVDATPEGASQPYYILGENLRIEEIK